MTVRPQKLEKFPLECQGQTSTRPVLALVIDEGIILKTPEGCLGIT